MNPTIVSCADVLERAVRERRAIGRLSEQHDLSLDDAYAVQDNVTRRRVLAGDRVVGAKLGLTSRAKQEQMHVAEPVYGRLFAAGLHPAGEPVAVSDLIHPRVEPEIVLILGERLAGFDVGVDDVLAATEWVCAGLEVIDSRYDGYSFTAADVVADNTSEARVVLGDVRLPPDGLDLALIGVVLERDGEQLATAAGAATMGHPARATAMLVRHLAARGEALEAGSIVFTGGLTAAVPLEPGSVVAATYAHFGRIAVAGM